MQGFDLIRAHELKELHRMSLYFATFVLATAVVVAGIISSLVG